MAMELDDSEVECINKNEVTETFQFGRQTT